MERDSRRQHVQFFSNTHTLQLTGFTVSRITAGLSTWKKHFVEPIRGTKEHNMLSLCLREQVEWNSTIKHL